MPKPYPQEFRDDVVVVARQGQTPLSQIAKGFRTSDGTSNNRIKRADVEGGHRPGLTEEQSAELPEFKKRNRVLKPHNEVLRRASAYLSQANLP